MGRRADVGDGAPVRAQVPDGITACLFDVDGVLTQTAAVHAEAWRELFDDYLRRRSERTGGAFEPVRMPQDYLAHIDGKLRIDGVRSFLESRGISVPEGSPGDPPEVETLHGLGARKNERFAEVIRRHGVAVFESSLRYVESVRARGLRLAVVSASRNCASVLDAAGIADLFEVRVDGEVAAERGLRGKPAPDMFVEAARSLGVTPAGAAVFEDAVAGVQAARAGGFGWVVGVDRGGHAEALAAAGADVVVGDLSELLEER